MRKRTTRLLCLGVMALTSWLCTPALAAGDRYIGQTSQGQPISFDTAPDGVRFHVNWAANCDDGGNPFEATTTSRDRLPVRSGAFSTRERYRARAEDGALVRYQVALAGQLNDSAAQGTWQAQAAGPTSAGFDYLCDSGSVTWTATRSGPSPTEGTCDDYTVAANRTYTAEFTEIQTVGITCSLGNKILASWGENVTIGPHSTTAAGYRCVYKRFGSDIGHVRCASGGRVVAADWHKGLVNL